MKENILFVILLCAGIGAGFAAGLYVGKDKAEDRQEAQRQHSHASRDTTTLRKETPLPEQRKEVRTAPRLTAGHSINADSVFGLGLAAGMDSVRRLFAYYTAPRETSIVFDSVGKLLHLSDRLRDMEIYTLQPFPRIETERTITDTVYVPQDGPPSPWWDHWYVGALGILTVEVVAVKAFGAP